MAQEGNRRVTQGAVLLREWRAAKGLTQEEAGRVIGIDMVRVSKYERGHLIPGRKLALKLFRGARIPIDAWDEPAKEPRAGRRRQTRMAR